MTRKQRRLAERVDHLEDVSDRDRPAQLDHLDWVPGRPPDLSIAEKRELEDSDGEPIDPDDRDAGQLIIINEALVMERGKAEREGREILEPAGGEGIPEGRDLVRVVDDGRPFQRERP